MPMKLGLLLMKRKSLFALIAFLFCIPLLQAQDSLKTTVDSSKSLVRTSVVKTYLLYNYTGESINNHFSEGWRHDANNRIDVDFDFSSNSNAVPALLSYDLLFNYPISDALKNRADNLLRNNLKFEENMKTGATYRRYMKRADLTLIVGYDYRLMTNLIAPKQAFETAFYGNARFEGDTANLSNINFEFYNYNQYSLGIAKKIDYGKYQMEFGVTGSLLQAVNQVQIETGNDTWLYTAPYGEFISLNYNLTFNNALQGAPTFWGKTGFGGSGDFHLGFMNHDKWKVTFDLSDVGLMSFRKSPVNYSGSNYINFQGIEIPNLLNFSSQTFDTLNLDSALMSKLPSKSSNWYSVFLPFTAQLAFSKPLDHDKVVLTIGVQYRYLPQYYIYGYAKVNYFIKPDMTVSFNVGAGGYSLCNVGAEFSKSWKYIDFSIGSSNLIGLVLPSSFPGSALYLRLGTSF
jgi:hypothetical protein